jgi:cellulose synthase/poly-beta-1,6-N-acetylglucosamine synthase-like glycosyltransferase
MFLYLLLFARLGQLWEKISKRQPAPLSTETPFLSVIIPFRNESENLPELCDALLEQSYPKNCFEVIFINDHSEDSGPQLLRQAFTTASNFSLLELTDEIGKKSALALGIERAKSEWIITLDADVTIGSHWLSSISKGIQQPNTDLLILPITFTGKSILQHLQIAEFACLIGTTAATADVKRALLCNGGNLAFKKALYQKAKANLHQETSSGDDIFLLHQAKKNDRTSIRWWHHSDSIARTVATNSFKSFIDQRIRWSSKSKHYRDRDTWIFGALLFLGNWAFVIFLFDFFSRSSHHTLGFLLAISKITVDAMLAAPVLDWLGQTKSRLYIVAVSILYPFYILIVPILGFFYSPKWKGRMISLAKISSK